MEKKELEAFSTKYKLTTEQLEKIYKEFVAEGKQRNLKTKPEIVQASKKCGLWDAMAAWEAEAAGIQIGPLDEKLEKKLLSDPVTEDIMYHKILAMFDTNKDGEISFEEMVAGMSIFCKGTITEKATLMFHVIDLNGDGVLDLHELLELQKLASKAFTAAFLVGFRYGLKKELPLPKEKMDELVAKVSKCYESDEIAKLSAQKCMKHIDANADGLITLKEYCDFYSTAGAAKSLVEDIKEAVMPIATQIGANVAKTIGECLSNLVL